MQTSIDNTAKNTFFGYNNKVVEINGLTSNEKKIDFVLVALVRGDGKLLLQLRDNKIGIDCPNQWTLPGGGIDPSENAEKAAEREIYEETGYDVSNKLIFISNVGHKLPSGKIKLGKLYCTVYDNIHPIHCYEGQKMVFVDPRNLDKLNFVEGLDISVHLFVKLTEKVRMMYSFLSNA